MPIIVNNIDELPINIFQIELSRLKLLDAQFLNNVVAKYSTMVKIVVRNNYWMIDTEARSNTLATDKKTFFFHQLLRFLRAKKGYTHLMIVNNTTT